MTPPTVSIRNSSCFSCPPAIRASAFSFLLLLFLDTLDHLVRELVGSSTEREFLESNGGIASMCNRSCNNKDDMAFNVEENMVNMVSPVGEPRCYANNLNSYQLMYIVV